MLFTHSLQPLNTKVTTKLEVPSSAYQTPMWYLANMLQLQISIKERALTQGSGMEDQQTVKEKIPPSPGWSKKHGEPSHLPHPNFGGGGTPQHATDAAQGAPGTAPAIPGSSARLDRNRDPGGRGVGRRQQNTETPRTGSEASQDAPEGRPPRGVTSGASSAGWGSRGALPRLPCRRCWRAGWAGFSAPQTCTPSTPGSHGAPAHPPRPRGNSAAAGWASSPPWHPRAPRGTAGRWAPSRSGTGAAGSEGGAPPVTWRLRRRLPRRRLRARTGRTERRRLPAALGSHCRARPVPGSREAPEPPAQPAPPPGRAPSSAPARPGPAPAPPAGRAPARAPPLPPVPLVCLLLGRKTSRVPSAGAAKGSPGWLVPPVPRLGRSGCRNSGPGAA